MNRTASWLALAIVFALAPAPGARGADTYILAGEYMSGFQDEQRPLEAIFVATGDERWEVAFHFNFNGQDHTYKGTAEGSLSDGELRGKVYTEKRSRTFTFQGRFEEGKFRGTHAEIGGGGRETKTGKLTLES